MNAEFEKYAHDQFDQYEVPVDTEALWAEIEPVIRPKKDNRRFLWFFLCGLLIGGIGIAGLYKGLQPINDNASNTAELSTLAIKQDAPSSGSENQVAANDPLPTPNVNATQIEKSVQGNIPAPQTQASLYRERPKPLLDQIEVSTENNNTVSKNAKNDNLNQLTLGIPNNDLSLGNDEGGKEELTKIELDNNSALLLNQDESQAQNEIASDAWSKALAPLSLFNGSIAAEERFAAEMETLEAIKEDLEKEDLSEILNNQAKNKNIKRRSPFFRDIQFGIGAYGGISRSTTELAPRTAADQTYELLRINSEKQLETLHAGLSALIVSDEKLYLRTGVEYTRIGSLFSQSSSRVEIDSVPGIVEIQINEVTGDTTEIPGNLLRTRTTSYIKKSYNYFHLVDVPIIFGYNFGSENVTIGIEAGIYANVFLQNKGEVFQPDESFYDKGEDPDGWYKNNIGISPFIGCNIAYHLNENLQLHLSPGFRFQSVYSTSSNPLKEQHANLGVTAGVRYIFDN